MKKILGFITFFMITQLAYASSCNDVFNSLIPTQEFSKASFTSSNLQKLLGQPRSFSVDANSHLLIWVCENAKSAQLSQHFNGSIALLVKKNKSEEIAWTLFSNSIGINESLDTDTQVKTFENYQKLLEHKLFPVPKDHLSCDDIFQQMHTVFSASNNYPIHALQTIYPWEDEKWLLKTIGKPSGKMMATRLWECAKDKYVTFLSGSAGGFIECDDNFCLVNNFFRTAKGLRTDFNVWTKEDWVAS